MSFILLKTILAYSLPWLTGYVEVRLLDRQEKFSSGYRLVVAYLLGIGSFTLQIFIAGVLGLRFSLGLFLGIAAADLLLLEIIAVLWSKKFILPRRPAWGGARQRFFALPPRTRALLVVCVGLIALKVGASVWQVAQTRVSEFDAWHDWNFRAKVIFTQHRLPIEDKNADFYLGGGESSYPLHDALSKVWTATLTGGWREPIVDAYSIVYFVLLVALFYFSLPVYLPLGVRLLALYLFSSLPYLYFHSWVAYADLEFATYLFLSLSALFWFFTSSYRAYLFVAAAGLAGVIWTKNEGFAVVLPWLLVSGGIWLVLKKVAWRPLIRYFSLALLLASPWLIFRFFNRLDILSGGSSSFHLVFNRQFLDEWFSTVFLRSHFNFLWLLFFFLLAVKARAIVRHPPLLLLSMATLGLFFFYNGIVLFTDKAYDLSALTRVNLHIAPFAAFLTTLLLGLDFNKDKKVL